MQRLKDNTRACALSVMLLSSACVSFDATEEVGADGVDDDAGVGETLADKALPNSSLPPRPSVSGMRNVSMIENRRFTRPHIPPYRTSHDGRVALQTKTSSSSRNSAAYRFFLNAPEKVGTSLLGSANGATILSNTNPVRLRMGQFVGGTDPGASIHSMLCDPGRNPRTCGTGGRNDCYDLKVITPFRNTRYNRMELWGTRITVEVRNPKTASASIASITPGTPNRGVIWPTVTDVLESMITADGHLLVARVSNAPLTWRDDAGRSFSGNRNMIYAYSDSSAPPCDETRFSNPYPITHAPYHRAIRERYGFARYPWTDGEGSVIPDGAETGITYPWVDSKGDNIFFVWMNSTLIDRNPSRSDWLVRCVPGTGCTQAIPANSNSMEDSGNQRGVSVAGEWTQGRTILLDNMLNNTDWGVRSPDAAHREVKYYSDANGWVRIGNGRDNLDDSDPRKAPGASGNSAFIDSLESKLNYLPQMKPSVPRDVAWYVNNGKATDVVAFDDWIDPHVLITSEMVQSVRLSSRARFEVRPQAIQNGAGTKRYRTPAYGEVQGAGRVEEVALGGVRGKGFYAQPTGGIRYRIPTGQPVNMANETWYVGIFVDPRFGNDGTYRRLMQFPDGSAIELRGLSQLSYVTASGQRQTHTLAQPLPANDYSHLGFRVSAGSSRVEFFRDGMLAWDWNNTGRLSLLRMGPGDLWLGRGSANTPAFAGWLDDFKVIGASHNMSYEVICNHALGSLVGLQSNASTALRSEASRYPSAFHAGVRTALNGRDQFTNYLCFDHNRNQDGWMDLNRLPTGVVSVRDPLLFPEGPLVAGAPRPDSHANAFCLSCHADDRSGRRASSLLEAALTYNPSAAMEVDSRRQPQQPPSLIFGNIPQNYFGPSLPATHLVLPAAGTSVDRFINAP